MKDGYVKNVMAKGRSIGDCPIVIAECFAVRDTIVLTIQKNIQKIIIESDSWLLTNFINGKICIPKESGNLVENRIFIILSRH